MNLTDPNRLSTAATFMHHCSAQHAATIERIEATTEDGVERELKKRNTPSS